MEKNVLSQEKHQAHLKRWLFRTPTAHPGWKGSRTPPQPHLLGERMQEGRTVSALPSHFSRAPKTDALVAGHVSGTDWTGLTGPLLGAARDKCGTQSRAEDSGA